MSTPGFVPALMQGCTELCGLLVPWEREREKEKQLFFFFFFNPTQNWEGGEDGMELGLLLYLWEGMAAVLPNAAIPVTEKTPSGGLPCPKQSIKTASGDCV